MTRRCNEKKQAAPCFFMGVNFGYLMSLPGSFQFFYGAKFKVFMAITNPFDILVALAERGSLSGAAERLKITQPGATKALQRLEAEIGAPLVERSSRGMAFTVYGEAVLARARQIDTTLRHTLEELNQLRGQHDGEITIGISSVATVTLLPKVLARYELNWGNILVRVVPINFPQTIVPLRDGSIDVAVVTIFQEPPLLPEFQFEPLMRTSAVVVARRGHPMAGATSIAALGGASWILNGQTGSGALLLTKAFAEVGLRPPSIRRTSSSMSGLQSVIANSDLLGVLPVDPMRPRHFITPELVAIPLRENIFEGLRPHLISRANDLKTPALRRLCDLFVGEAQRFYDFSVAA